MTDFVQTTLEDPRTQAQSSADDAPGDRRRRRREAIDASGAISFHARVIQVHTGATEDMQEFCRGMRWRQTSDINKPASFTSVSFFISVT